MGTKRTHCAKGHELTDDNVELYKRSDGRVQRTCRKCRLLRRKTRINWYRLPAYDYP